MIKISFNKSLWYNMIIIGIILIPVPFFLSWAFFFHKMKDVTIDFIAPIIIFISFIALILLWIQLLFLPFQVIIDESNQLLIINFLFLGERIINIQEIESYSSIVISAGKYPRTKYDGILIHLKNKRLIQCSDFNFRNYKPIADFLENSSTVYLGKEMFRFRNYYKNCLK